MRKAIYITLTAVVLASCGGNSNKSLDKALASKDIETIRSKHAEVSSQKKALEKQLKSLDSAIALLDKSEKQIGRAHV